MFQVLLSQGKLSLSSQTHLLSPKPGSQVPMSIVSHTSTRARVEKRVDTQTAGSQGSQPDTTTHLLRELEKVTLTSLCLCFLVCKSGGIQYLLLVVTRMINETALVKCVGQCPARNQHCVNVCCYGRH